jgi:hypothetical protein
MADGLGDNYTATIVLECGASSIQPSSIYFDELVCQATANLLSVGGEFSADTAKAFRVGSLKVNLLEYTDVIIANNSTGMPFAMGAVAELTAGIGTSAGITDPTHTETHDKVVVINGKGMGFANGHGWLCAARGNTAAVRVADAAPIVPGAGLGVEVGNRSVVVGASPFLAVALEGRAADSTALVKVSRL